MSPVPWVRVAWLGVLIGFAGGTVSAELQSPKAMENLEALALYQSASKARYDGRLREAESLWREIVTTYPHSSFVDVAHYEIGYLKENRAERAAAISAYAKVLLRDGPDTEDRQHYRHLAAYRTALCYEALGKPKLALEWAKTAREFRFSGDCGTCLKIQNNLVAKLITNLQAKVVPQRP